MRHANRKHKERPLDVKGNLALASAYFYLGYYSGMRHCVNSMKSLNLDSMDESAGMRSMIELLPAEVAALRLGADPEYAILKIKQLLSEKSREIRSLAYAKTNMPTQ